MNLPSHVLATTRESNAQRLATIPNVRTPKIATLARDFFDDANAEAKLQQMDFSFPLLVRAPGYHTGEHFLRVGTASELPGAVAALPGERICVIELLDARAGDGLTRKYRVMSIGGQLFPAHAAVSSNWKIHFFSSSAPEHDAARAEDREFVEGMERVLRPGTMATLRHLQETLQLDYAGMDFSIGSDEKLLLFEANATMNIPAPEPGEMWAYRQAPVGKIADAVRALLFTKAFKRGDGTLGPPTPVLREFTLRRIEDALAREPDRTDLDIERARLLIEMERFEEARSIYVAILSKTPLQFVALNNLGTVLRAMGYHKPALEVHRQVAALVPDDLKARVNLANSLRECSELDEARANYETVLKHAPDNAEAHKGLAYVLLFLGEKAAAWEHRRKALAGAPEAPPIIRGNEGAPRVLIISSPCGGNSPITRLLDSTHFQTIRLVADFYDPTVPLPPHDVVLNAVGEADQCGTSLEALSAMLAQTSRPVLNRPERVRTTGRADNARLLGQLEDVVTPRIVSVPRDELIGSGAVAKLQALGFAFPVLLRSPGFHEGSHFVRVEKPDDLAKQAAGLPGRQLMVIEYLDARDADGKIRKYRAMMIDAALYPLHKAISHEWMIHYFSAEMADSAEHRAEDAAYLENMAGVLGPRAVAALQRIQAALELEYAGADFSLARDGRVLLFEANATMAVPLPDHNAQWDYRRPAVRRIQDATRAMILARAKSA